MTIGLLGKKIRNDERIYGVRSVNSSYCNQSGKGRVLDVISKEKRGYDAIKVGFFKMKNSKLTNQMKGYFSKKNTEPKKILKEFRIDNNEQYKEGNEFGLEIFKDKKFLDVNLKQWKGFCRGNEKMEFWRIEKRRMVFCFSQISWINRTKTRS